MQRHSLVSHAPHRGLNPERHDAIALVERVFLIISVVPIAILANAARVTGTGILAHTVGQHLAEVFFHGFVGWIMLLLGACAWRAEILLLGQLADVEEGHASCNRQIIGQPAARVG